MSGPIPDPEQIARAVARLRTGGVVAFPTETVYGLGADALDPECVRRVFQLKGRPAHNPLIVHVSGVEMARRVVAAWPEPARRAADAFWPGPLTLVLPRAAVVPPIVTAGGPTVAVRCPDHPLTLALIEAFGSPIVGPSANPSGAVSPTRPEHVREAFSEEDVLVLDGGPCRVGIESAVLLLPDEPRSPRLLRPGIIGAEAIARVIGRPVEAPIGDEAAAGHDPHAAPPGALPSPGMLPVHYAPRAPALLVGAGEVPRLLTGAGVVVVVSHMPIEVRPPHVLVTLPPDPRGYAAGLYAALRRADEASPTQIAVVRPPSPDSRLSPEESAAWRAVLDRLVRATRRV